MELAQEKIDLISRIIKNDRKYPNNEDLYDDFFNETYKRSLSIIDAIDSEVTLEAYIKRIVTTSIINVLKDSGRLRRTKSGYLSTKELSIDADESVDYSRIDVSYSNFNVPNNPEEIAIERDFLEFIADTIKKVNDNEPEQDYLHIYTLRYDKGMTQKEISEEVGISQSEVSKRLYKLMEKVKLALD